MRRRHILLSYAILLLLIAGCGRNEEKLFPFEDFRRLEGRAVCEDMLVGRPSRLTVIDSLLIFSDKLDDRLVTIANPKSGESRRAVFTGRGPGEMMMIRRIYRDDDGRIFLFDINTHKIISYSADKSYQELLSPNTRLGETAFSYDEVPYEVITFGDGYIANGNFDGRQFSLLDGDGRSTGYFGVYPGNNDDVGSGDAFFMKNQTLMAVKPDQSRFAAAGYSNDQLVTTSSCSTRRKSLASPKRQENISAMIQILKSWAMNMGQGRCTLPRPDPHTCASTQQTSTFTPVITAGR